MGICNENMRMHVLSRNENQNCTKKLKFFKFVNRNPFRFTAKLVFHFIFKSVRFGSILRYIFSDLMNTTT